MSKAEHTPGPWHHEFDNDVGCWCVVSDSREMPAIYIDQDRDIDEPNARLIAAAPELFAVVNRLANHEEGESLTLDDYRQIARAAFVKAMGE